MSRRSMRGSRHGATLMETVAAIVLLAVAIPPLMWTLSDAQHRQIDVVFTSRARWLVMEKLEEVLADRHSDTRGWTHLVNSNYPSEAAVSGFDMYERSVSITETGPDLQSAGSGYKTITVDVQWEDSNGTTRSLAISTVVTELTP